LAGELRDGFRAEEVTVWVDVRGVWVPFGARNGVGVENGPDRSAAVELGGVAVVAHGGGKEAIAAVGLVPEALAHLIDEDHVLPVLDGDAGRARELEGRAVWFKEVRAVAPLASAVSTLGVAVAPFGVS